ncbi:MAG: PAS domain-containing protein [Rhodocyclaceae bacterium]
MTQTSPDTTATRPAPASPPRQAATFSLRNRLTALFALCMLLCAGFATAYLASRQNHGVTDQVDTQTRAIASSIAALSLAEVAANDRIALTRRLESFNELEIVRALAVTDRQGAPLAAARRNAAGNLAAVSGRELGNLGDPGAPPAMSDSAGARVVWASIGQIAPIGWVRLEYETGALEQARRRQALEATIFILASVLAASVLVHWMVGRTLRGLRRAARYATALERGDSARAPMPSHEAREVREIIEALKHHAETLDQLRDKCHCNEAQFRRLLDDLPQPVFELDPEFRIRYANAAMHALLAARFDSDPPDTLDTLLHAGEPERLAEPLQALIRGTREHFDEQVRIGGTAAPELWLNLKAYRTFGDDGRFRSLMCSATRP